MAAQISPYRTAKETAVAWGVSKRWVNMCIADGRIPGAYRLGNLWLVPADAEKPESKRRGMQTPEYDLSADFVTIVAATTAHWPKDDPDAILHTVYEDRLRLQFQGELAYLRGDYAQVVQCFRAIGDDTAAKLRACSLTIAAAVSLGDYPLFAEIDTWLKSLMEEHKGEATIVAFAQLCLATAYTGAIAPNMVPDWLKNGDFSALPISARPDAAYKRAKYFQCVGHFESMLNTAQTALSFCTFEQKISFHDVYFRVACAIACTGLGQNDAAKKWLADALRIAVPHGFLAPFVESATTFGGLLEQLLEREYPAILRSIPERWERSFSNWIAFHNQFTRANITLMLSLREYEMAAMVVRRVPRAQIAAQFHISPGRLNNIMKEIYSKLYVTGREELSKFIM